MKCFVFQNLLWEASQTTVTQLKDSKDDINRKRPFPAGIDMLPSDGGNLITGTLPANDPFQNQTKTQDIQNLLKKD